MIITLTGSNSFMLKQELERLKNEFISKYGDLAYEKVDGEEVPAERLIEAAQSLPFLAPEKLVVLYNLGSQKQFSDSVENVISGVPETTRLVIVEPKVDKRSSYFKVLKSITDFKEYNELDNFELSKWIVQYAKDQSGNITPADANYLIEKIGQSQMLLASELDKLLNYSPNIDRQNIDLLTDRTSQSTIFELLDAVFAGRSKQALDLYHEQRALKVEPQQIIAMLAWQLHTLAMIKTAGDKTPDQIAKEAKLNPFVVRKSLAIAKRLTTKQLKDMIRKALELDVRLKTESINPDDALQEYLLGLAIS